MIDLLSAIADASYSTPSSPRSFYARMRCVMSISSCMIIIEIMRAVAGPIIIFVKFIFLLKLNSLTFAANFLSYQSFAGICRSSHRAWNSYFIWFSLKTGIYCCSTSSAFGCYFSLMRCCGCCWWIFWIFVGLFFYILVFEKDDI